jgi:hypothetical protein
VVFGFGERLKQACSDIETWAWNQVTSIRRFASCAGPGLRPFDASPASRRRG